MTLFPWKTIGNKGWQEGGCCAKKAGRNTYKALRPVCTRFTRMQQVQTGLNEHLRTKIQTGRVSFFQ